MNELEGRFEKEMMHLYEEPKRLYHYNATYLLKMIHEHGHLNAAKILVKNPAHSEGLTKLWELGELGLSVEALSLRDPWNQLFSDDELEAAAKKLKDLDYSEPGSKF